jgi:phosphoglucomutase
MHNRAGTPATDSDLIDTQAVLEAFSSITPDPEQPSQRVTFGTSGHRGRSLDGSFNDAHIRAITQAIVDYRASAGMTGPVYVGADTHLLSAPALTRVLEVLAGNGVEALTDSLGRPTPTPAVSHAIIAHNRKAMDTLPADGIIITPSHNPPADGGIKYNPPQGGPADETITAVIAERANHYLTRPGEVSSGPPTPTPFDYVQSYVLDLNRVIEMDALRRLPLRVGVHPLGGAAIDYWKAIAETWSIPLDIVDDTIDPQFGFMTLDHDGAIRMDPSSPYAMAVTDSVGDYGLLVANDADADRHGIRTRAGLMDPNHFLAVAIDYLLGHRPAWPAEARVGKTMVSSSIIDRVVSGHARHLHEVPVGFKWFVDGLTSGTLCFGGEESAGAAPLAIDGSTWVSEKDGIVMGLLAMEILAVTGHDPAWHYSRLEKAHGVTHYKRTDLAATADIIAFLRGISIDDVSGAELAGRPITAALTEAPTGGRLGGIKLMTDRGWIAARPSGTEPIYKIYAESFVSKGHLDALLDSAKTLLEQGVDR